MYKTINGWTKQSMIEHIKLNFKGKSMLSSQDAIFTGEFCAYRSTEGKKCAVGIFIPDEIYSVAMERKNVKLLLLDFPELIEKMPLEEIQLNDLQRIHDDDSQSSDTILYRMLSWIEKNVG